MADVKSNSFPRTCCSTHDNYDKREPVIQFQKKIRFTEMLCLCSKTYCCYDNNLYKIKISCKGLNKRVLEVSGDGTMSKYSRVLDRLPNVYT